MEVYTVVSFLLWRTTLQMATGSSRHGYTTRLYMRLPQQPPPQQLNPIRNPFILSNSIPNHPGPQARYLHPYPPSHPDLRMNDPNHDYYRVSQSPNHRIMNKITPVMSHLQRDNQ
ncbi:hypothetical protein M747DRAFT_23389 [Aspergillus niger ATCC 13496]|uniref:Uncharacterized protein n=1 Tax=Aspergillus niger ATCC 13496 TaxID=1353008 RepID=A0A370C3U9_ASPNG|nr:hypothetical protein M747DRAFT_23389 [Aspergillus niger ATCC 13496]